MSDLANIMLLIQSKVGPSGHLLWAQFSQCRVVSCVYKCPCARAPELLLLLLPDIVIRCDDVMDSRTKRGKMVHFWPYINYFNSVQIYTKNASAF